MVRNRNRIVTLSILTLLLAAAPAAAQKPRLLEGSFEAEITYAFFDPPFFYVLFTAQGTADPFGPFTVTDGFYIFDSAKFTLPAGIFTISTPQGDVSAYFEGSGVFTGRFNGVLYLYAGTGIYENILGVADLAAQFWLRDFTQGTATFTFVGSAWY